MSAPFLIHLPQFEGPFDLLLFFIERDELSINDIPIHKITTEFLDYIKHLERLNIEVASEFILVAATLMRIKAKMLLPRKEVDEQGNEIDPREELVQQLLEYKRVKDVVEAFKDLEANRSLKYARGNQKNEVEDLIKWKKRINAPWISTKLKQKKLYIKLIHINFLLKAKKKN